MFCVEELTSAYPRIPRAGFEAAMPNVVNQLEDMIPQWDLFCGGMEFEQRGPSPHHLGNKPPGAALYANINRSLPPSPSTFDNQEFGAPDNQSVITDLQTLEENALSQVIVGEQEARLLAESVTSSEPGYEEVSSVVTSGNRRFSNERCKVCGDEATGMYFGAIVCVPCKTFFLRYAGDNFAFVCKYSMDCEITVATRTQCKYCRYQKCLQAGMCRRERPAQVQISEGQQMCVVCSDIANGVHFGAITCEGCKKFFRRGLQENNTYTCKNSQDCVINPRTRNSCRYCRYQKCLVAGMSREAIQMGRPAKIKPMGSSLSSIQKEAKALQKMGSSSDSNSPRSPNNQQLYKPTSLKNPAARGRSKYTQLLSTMPYSKKTADSNHSGGSGHMTQSGDQRWSHDTVGNSNADDDLMADFFIGNFNTQQARSTPPDIKPRLLEVQPLSIDTNPAKEAATKGPSRMMPQTLAGLNFDRALQPIVPPTTMSPVGIQQLSVPQQPPQMTGNLPNSTQVSPSVSYNSGHQSGGYTPQCSPVGQPQGFNTSPTGLNPYPAGQAVSTDLIHCQTSRQSRVHELIDELLAQPMSILSQLTSTRTPVDVKQEATDVVHPGVSGCQMGARPMSSYAAKINGQDGLYENSAIMVSGNDTGGHIQVNKSLGNNTSSSCHNLGNVPYSPPIPPQLVTRHDNPGAIINPLTSTATSTLSSVSAAGTNNNGEFPVTSQTLPPKSSHPNDPILLPENSARLQKAVMGDLIDQFQIKQEPQDCLTTDTTPLDPTESAIIDQMPLSVEDPAVKNLQTISSTLDASPTSHIGESPDKPKHRPENLFSSLIHLADQIGHSDCDDVRENSCNGDKEQSSMGELNLEHCLSYWQQCTLPDENVMFSERHIRLIDQIMPAYHRFVATGTSINQRLRKELESKVLELSDSTGSLETLTPPPLPPPPPRGHTDLALRNTCISPWDQSSLPPLPTLVDQRLFTPANRCLLQKWLKQSDLTDCMRDSTMPQWVMTKVVPVYTLSSVTFCKDLPGFLELNATDQCTLIRLGQSQSRILVAAVHWYNHEDRDFRDFLCWRTLSAGHEDEFKRKLVEYAEVVNILEIDTIEAALLNALVIVAIDYPGLKNTTVIEEKRLDILRAFRAYTTAKYGTPNSRIERLFSCVPQLRQLGLLHHKMTQQQQFSGNFTNNSTNNL